MKKLTTEEFIEKAKAVHGDLFDYSKVEYINSQTKVCIICKEHGEFYQTPNCHLSGQRCPKCANKNVTTSEFIKKANKIHKDKYNYSKVTYFHSKEPVIIICPIHGEFKQKPNSHLLGHGCSKCKNLNLTNEEWISRFKEVHGNKYRYDLVNYVNSEINVMIICPKHGIFYQKPAYHIQGYGCAKCAGFEKTTEEIIELFKEVHGDTYDYSLVKYSFRRNKVKIICKKHGIFEQIVGGHLGGQGCPKCNRSHGESKIALLLTQQKILYSEQHGFKACKNLKKLPFDFYIPEYDLLIEYDGEHHYRPIKGRGGSSKYLKTKKNDLIKDNFARENGIRLLRIPYWDFDNIEEILEKELNS